MAYWRLRHRLTALTISGSDRPQITAKVNPESIVTTAVRKIGGEVHRILREIGEALINDPDVRREARAADRDRQRGRGAEDDPRQARSPAAEAALLQGAHGTTRRPGGTSESITMARGVTVNEEQTWSSAPGHIETQGVSPPPGTGGRYDPHIRQVLTDMQGAGLSPNQIRLSFFRLMRGRPPANYPAFRGEQGAALRDRFAAVARIVAPVEGGRRSSTLATTYMGWSLLGRTNVKPEDAATLYNPMSPADSRAHGELVDLGKGAGTRIVDQNARNFLERELRVTIAYLEMRLAADPELFKTEGECIQWIRTRLKSDLLRRMRGIMTPA